MKILHLTTFLQGGAGRVIVDLAASQHRAGNEVIVLTSKTGAPGYENDDAYVLQLEGIGIPVHAVDSLFVREHAANLAVVRVLRERFPEGAEPAVIHAHAAIPSLIALAFAGARRTPLALIQTMYGWGVTKTEAQIATDVEVLNLVDRVAVPSRDALQQLVALGVPPGRITLVSYGVSDRSPDLEPRDQRLVEEMNGARRAGALVVACVGTIGWRKNQQMLVEAIRQLRDAALPVFGVFVGDGDARPLRDAVVSLELDAVCRIHGPSRAARRIGAAGDVLVLPSRSEGQPLAVLEAFADGTLVAVSNTPELLELVKDGDTGVRFSANNAESLAATLRRLARMPHAERQLIVGRARARHAAEFTDALMARNYFDIYRDVLRRRGARTPTALPAA